MTTEKQLGQVKKAEITFGERGILQFYIEFNFGDTEQAYARILDDYDSKKKKRVGTAFGLECIIRLMQVFNVENFSEIKDRIVYVYRANDVIVGIQALAWDGGKSFLIEDIAKEFGILT